MREDRPPRSEGEAAYREEIARHQRRMDWLTERRRQTEVWLPDDAMVWPNLRGRSPSLPFLDRRRLVMDGGWTVLHLYNVAWLMVQHGHAVRQAEEVVRGLLGEQGVNDWRETTEREQGRLRYDCRRVLLEMHAGESYFSPSGVDPATSWLNSILAREMGEEATAQWLADRGIIPRDAVAMFDELLLMRIEVRAPGYDRAYYERQILRWRRPQRDTGMMDWTPAIIGDQWIGMTGTGQVATNSAMGLNAIRRWLRDGTAVPGYVLSQVPITARIVALRNHRLQGTAIPSDVRPTIRWMGQVAETSGLRRCEKLRREREALAEAMAEKAARNWTALLSPPGRPADPEERLWYLYGRSAPAWRWVVGRHLLRFCWRAGGPLTVARAGWDLLRLQRIDRLWEQRYGGPKELPIPEFIEAEHQRRWTHNSRDAVAVGVDLGRDERTVLQTLQLDRSGRAHVLRAEHWPPAPIVDPDRSEP